MARAELITRAAVQDGVRKFPHHPGIVKARELAALIEPAAESPGESWLRLRMIDAGFTPPVPQIEITDGVNEYRVDMGFSTRSQVRRIDISVWSTTRTVGTGPRSSSSTTPYGVRG
jgi:hypothetical protein